MEKDKVAILIKKTALAVEKLSNQVLASYALTSTQYKILMMLYHSPEMSVRQGDIEERFALTNPTVTGILQNLEKKDLVLRVHKPGDRRSKYLALTEKALSLREEIQTLGGSLEAQITKNLSTEECEQLCILLKKMLETN